MSKDFDFKGVVSWGRTFQEYATFFALDEENLRQRGPVLDVGGGPASFTCEACAKGINATAVDPVYATSGESIRAGCDATTPTVIEGYNRAYGRINWAMYGSPEGLVRKRYEALDLFLADYDRGRAVGRYVVGSLPRLPFADDQFSLALCSHMLFLYSHVLGLDFHLAALNEALRVASEARVFPLLNLDGEMSPHLAPVIEVMEARGFLPSIVPVPFEFQKGGGQMLCIVRP